MDRDDRRFLGVVIVVCAACWCVTLYLFEYAPYSSFYDGPGRRRAARSTLITAICRSEQPPSIATQIGKVDPTKLIEEIGNEANRAVGKAEGIVDAALRSNVGAGTPPGMECCVREWNAFATIATADRERSLRYPWVFQPDGELTSFGCVLLILLGLCLLLVIIVQVFSTLFLFGSGVQALFRLQARLEGR